MNIGLIAMSGKPVHAGHIGLINLASKENNKVIVFVSLSTRARSGEMPVYEEDMKNIWENVLLSIMPNNVEVQFVKVPVLAIYTFLGEKDISTSTDTFMIYSDPIDLQERFSDTQLQKYLPRLYDNGLVVPRPIKRTETVDVSGTKIRQAIASNDFETFEKGMPRGTAKQIWDILSKRANEITPEKKTRTKKNVKEAIAYDIRKMVSNLIRRH